MASLVSRLTNTPIVTFTPGQSEPVCSNHAIKNLLSRTGIKIPSGHESAFHNQAVVYLEDPLFQEAFLKYWMTRFDPSLYFLQDSALLNKPFAPPVGPLAPPLRI